MKKTVLFFLLLALSFSALAIINGMTPGAKSGDKTFYEVGVKVEKGWNLLVGVGTLMDQASALGIKGGDIQREDIKSMWAFVPTTQSYARVHPNPETEKLTVIDDDELLATSFWLYSEKEGYLRFQSESILEMGKRQLYSGWNFVAITPEVRGRSFQEIFAECEAQKSYVYNNRVYAGHNSPSWEKVYPESKFTSDIEGVGMIVRVSGNCKMVSSEEAAAPPPPLPS